MAAVTIGTRLRRAKQDGKSGGVQMRLRSSMRLPFAPALIFRRYGMMGPGPAVSERFGRRVVVVTGGSTGIDGAIPNGAADDALISERIADQEACLETLTKQRESISGSPRKRESAADRNN
jgi:hypothetical protein